MNRVILILIILATHVNVCYAAFPIFGYFTTNTLQTDELKECNYTLQQIGLDFSSCQCVNCQKVVSPMVIKQKLMPVKLKDTLKEKDKIGSGGSLYILLSILSGLCSLLFGFLSLGNALSHGGSYSAVLFFFLLFVVSIFGSVILALKAKKQGFKWRSVMLGIGVALLSLVLFIPLFFS